MNELSNVILHKSLIYPSPTKGYHIETIQWAMHFNMLFDTMVEFHNKNYLSWYILIATVSNSFIFHIFQRCRSILVQSFLQLLGVVPCTLTFSTIDNNKRKIINIKMHWSYYSHEVTETWYFVKYNCKSTFVDISTM